MRLRSGHGATGSAAGGPAQVPAAAAHLQPDLGQLSFGPLPSLTGQSVCSLKPFLLGFATSSRCLGSGVPLRAWPCARRPPSTHWGGDQSESPQTQTQAAADPPCPLTSSGERPPGVPPNLPVTPTRPRSCVSSLRLMGRKLDRAGPAAV